MADERDRPTLDGAATCPNCGAPDYWLGRLFGKPWCRKCRRIIA